MLGTSTLPSVSLEIKCQFLQLAVEILLFKLLACLFVLFLKLLTQYRQNTQVANVNVCGAENPIAEGK